MKGPNHQTIGDNVLPINYNLSFEPDMKRFVFSGSARIKIRVKRRTKKILLNAKELKISGAAVASRGVKQIARCSLNAKREELSLIFKKPIAGDAELEIKFQGVHNDGMYGFYRSRYTYANKTGYILTSQFEAPNARAAFPCFDEPEFKAIFEVSMLVENGLDAISNMPIRSIVKSGKKKLITFETTPKMSSYLLYLAAGRFDYLNGKYKKVDLRVVTTPGKKELAKIALDYVKKFLAYEEKYFGIRYPLPKLDLIAVPDFAAGAMENWGAITFRETALLGDEKKTSIAGKQRIAEVIAHELTHQWFGDLVTMRWWDDIWLNESFARLFEKKVVDEIFPEWKYIQGFYESTISAALSADALKATHPIYVKVNKPEEIESIFDVISYNKGGSVLFMLEDFVGKEAYRKGLHYYLKNHGYSNATKDDLWNCIQKAAHEHGQKGNVTRMIHEWVTKPGYPIVHVGKNADGGFDLKQKRYSMLDSDPGENETWPVPIHYSSDGGEGRVLMEDREARLKSDSPWIKLNYGQAGFYRVEYEEDILRYLGERIDSKELGDVDASGIANDLFTLVRTGRAPITDYLNFVDMYMMDVRYPADTTVSGHLGYMMLIAKGEKYERKIKSTCIAFHKKILNRLGWERKNGESSTDTRARGMAISALGLAGDRETADAAKRIFDAYVHKGRPIDTNLTSSIYRVVAYNFGDEKMYDLFLKRYQTERLPDEKVKAMQTIGMLPSERLITKALDDALSHKRMRLQDSFYVYGNVSGNPSSKPVLWGWTKRNWKRILKTYPSSMKMLDNMVATLSLYSDAKTRKEISAFFKKKGNMRIDIGRELDKTLERIDANIRFIDANREEGQILFVQQE